MHNKLFTAVWQWQFWLPKFKALSGICKLVEDDFIFYFFKPSKWSLLLLDLFILQKVMDLQPLKKENPQKLTCCWWQEQDLENESNLKMSASCSMDENSNRASHPWRWLICKSICLINTGHTTLFIKWLTCAIWTNSREAPTLVQQCQVCPSNESGSGQHCNQLHQHGLSSFPPMVEKRVMQTAQILIC